MTNLAGIVRDAQEARGEWLARGELPDSDSFPLHDEYASLTKEEVARIFGASCLLYTSDAADD